MASCEKRSTSQAPPYQGHGDGGTQTRRQKKSLRNGVFAVLGGALAACQQELGDGSPGGVVRETVDEPGAPYLGGQQTT